MNQKTKKRLWIYIFFFLLLFLLIIESFLAIYRKHRSTVVERKVEETIKLYWNHSPIYFDYMKYFTRKELGDSTITGLSQEELLSYETQALKNNALVIGPLKQVNTDNMGIYLFKGIFNEYGKYGLLVCRINLSMVFHNTISHIKLGNEGYLSLGDINSNFNYYGNTDGVFFSTNRNISNDLSKMLVGYSFTNLGDTNILISARLPYREIEHPIRITFYLLLSLSIIILVIFTLFTYYLFHFRKKELEYTMELKLQEQMNKRNNNEVLGLFSRKIAHEYNNLLAPITIYCELLESELKDTDLLEYVNEIEQSSEQCVKLAKDLLQYGHSKTSNYSTITYDSVHVP